MAAAVAVAVVVFLIGMLIIAARPPLSPYDELVHLDAVMRVGQGQLNPPSGTVVTAEAMEIAACTGHAVLPDAYPACDSAPFDAEEFVGSAVNTATDGTPNPYYLVTGALLRVISPLGVDTLTAARTLSLLAHAIGVGLIVLAIQAVGGPLLMGSSLGLVAGISPLSITQGVTVSPDSWSLLAGGLAVILALRIREMRPPAIFLSILALGATTALLKPNWVLLAVVPWLVLVTGLSGSARAIAADRRFLAATASTAIAGLVGPIIYVAPSLMGTAADPEQTGDPVSVTPDNPFDLSAAFADLISSLQMPQGSYGLTWVSAAVAATWLVALANLWTTLFVGSAGLAFLQARFSGFRWSLSAAVLLVLLASPMFVYAGQLVGGYYFEYPQRYSLIVWPIAVTAFACAVSLRTAWVVIGALATLALTLVAVT